MKNAGKAFISNTLLVEILIIIFVILVGAIIFHYLEWLTLFDSLYFVMTTMATIWLWDITPHTDLWKVFVIIYSFLWVPLFMWVSWLILESRFNSHIKNYVSKFYRELHEAEDELKDVEDQVNKRLEDVLENTEETQDQVEENTDRIEEVEEKVGKRSKRKSKKNSK